MSQFFSNGSYLPHLPAPAVKVAAAAAIARAVANAPKPDPKQAILSVGSRVYCGLYGGNRGIVYAIHGQQAPASVGRVAGVLAYGGRAAFDIVFEDGHTSQQVPESIVRGVQWEIYPDRPLASADEIKAAMENVEAVQAAAERKAEAARVAFAAEVEKIKAENPHLIVGNDRNTAAKNIRVQLKRAFPGVKFSVRGDHSSINVGWVDGPAYAKVEAIVQKHKQGGFDGMQDIYEYSRSPWSETFGGVRYVFSNREASDALVAKAIEKLVKRYGNHGNPPSVAEYRKGDGYNRSPIGNASLHHDSWQSLINRELSEIE